MVKVMPSPLPPTEAEFAAWNALTEAERNAAALAVPDAQPMTPENVKEFITP